MMRLCLIQNDNISLVEIKQYCIHAEPNYGMLWFYYRNSILDNAIDIWNYAELAIHGDII
jgi:hypothetical protein